ncbi:hypothetical protein BaRGS_00021924 [Batillaria attramentaria]|uniref:Uncharacterized protein n=1 Tax=Batillaria attramentaria TaxID=370345 RepID=A0ABD0KIC0_9CAEN
MRLAGNVLVGRRLTGMRQAGSVQVGRRLTGMRLGESVKGACWDVVQLDVSCTERLTGTLSNRDTSSWKRPGGRSLNWDALSWDIVQHGCV